METIVDDSYYSKSELLGFPKRNYRVAGSMPIFVRTVTDEDKTISLGVERSDTIITLKLIIDIKEGIFPYDQRLFFSGMHLENDRTLADYNISAGSTLDVLLESTSGVFKIFVETISGKTITLKVNNNYTVRKVKELVHDEEGIRPDEQNLIYAGEKLDDRHRIALYLIQKESTLRLVDETLSRTAVLLQIHVNIVATRKTIHLEVESTDTIYNVKAKIQEKEDIPADQQTLFLPQKRLNDAFTLADYYIHNQSTLHLLHDPR